MISKKLKLMYWNVRGLGSDEKCNVVRNIIKNSRCEVVLFQETKCNRIDFAYVVRFLPSFFSHDIAYNLAINSAGGMIIAWKSSFHLIASWSTRHTLSVQLRHTGTNEIFTVSNA